MSTLIRGLCAAALLVVIGAGVSAEEKKKEEKKPANPLAKMFSFPDTIKLTEEQQKKLDALQKEYTPKLEELHKKSEVIMTPERHKAAKEAADKAKADGKKGKEVQEAVEAALKLSPEEKAQEKEIHTARHKLAEEITAKKMALLTDDQKAALKPKPKDK